MLCCVQRKLLDSAAILAMRKLRKIAVFCGSSSGSSSEYAAGARRLGEEMVRREIGLVYGGGSVGLMGVIAETVARGLGEENVIGVIPRALCPREVRAHCRPPGRPWEPLNPPQILP